MAKYYDPNSKQVYEVGNPEMNPQLTQGRTLVPETTALGGGYNEITSEDVKPVEPINLPKAPEDWYNYKGITSENNSISDLYKNVGVEEKPTDFTKMFKDLYTETGLATQEQGVLEKETSLKSAQNEFNLINAQLKALTDQSNIAPVQISKEYEGRAGMIQQNLMTQAKQRDIAIQSLPLQGQAYLAQAKVLVAQGDVDTAQKALEIATSKFNTLFNIQSKQAEMDYNYRKDLRDKVWEYATAKEKEKLDTLQKADDRKYEEQKTRIATINEWVKTAITNGQSTLVGEFAALDPKSATFEQDLAKITAKITPKAEKLDTSIVEINGRKLLVNNQTGTTIKDLGSSTGAGFSQEATNTLSGEFGNLITSASNLSPTVSGKATSKQSIAEAIVNQDYASAYAQIANNVEESITGTSKTKFADARTDYSMMLGLKQAIQDYADGGGDMGLLTGKEEDIKRKLGIDSGKASVLAVQLWREFQTYRSNMTGAAFSEQESRDYASVNPTLGKSLNLNLSVIEGALNQLENRITATINARIPGAKKLYDKVKGGTEQLNPATAPIGSTIEIDGRQYIKLGDDKFEEKTLQFNVTGK